MARPILPILVFALACSAAQAHNASRGVTRFALDGAGQVAIEMELNEADIVDLLYIDLSSPDQAALAAAGKLDARFSANLRRWLKLTAKRDGEQRPCPISFTSFEELRLRAYVVKARATCPFPPDELTIDWGLSGASAGLKLVHVGSVTAPGGVQHVVVLSKRDNKHTLVVRAPSMVETLSRFILLGGEHIALGWDHLLFLLALVLGCVRVRRVMLVVSAFTLAHSLTLALGAFEIVRISSDIIEPIIAFSIAAAAGISLARLRVLPFPGSGRADGSAWPALLLCFTFGLLHGLGFATMLQEALGPGAGLVTPLLAFNLGVELGQLAMVGAAFVLLSLVGRTRFGERFAGVLLAGLVLTGLAATAARVFG